MAPFHGFFADLQTFVDWGVLFDAHPAEVYSAGADAYRQGQLSFPPNYPPLAVELCGAMVRLHLWLASLLHGGAGLSAAGTPRLAMLMKLPSIAADLAAAALIRDLGRSAGRPRAGLLAAAACALSPALVVDGALWGQLDGIGADLVVVALVLAIRGHGAPAGAALAAAALLKPQPLVFAPLLGVFLWRRGGGRALGRGLLGAAAASLVICLPFLPGHAGELGALAGNAATVVHTYPFASFNAFNLWWLLGLAEHDHAAALLGPLSIDVLGTGLTLLALTLACLAVILDSSAERLLLAAAALAAVAFVAGSLQHERHLLQLVPLLAALAALRREGLWLLLGATGGCLLNMLLIALPSLPAGERLAWAGWWFEPHSSLARLLAAADLGLALVLLQRLVRGLPRRPRLA